MKIDMKDNKWLPSEDRDTLPLKETLILVGVMILIAIAFSFIL